MTLFTSIKAKPNAELSLICELMNFIWLFLSGHFRQMWSRVKINWPTPRSLLQVVFFNIYIYIYNKKRPPIHRLYSNLCYIYLLSHNSENKSVHSNLKVMETNSVVFAFVFVWLGCHMVGMSTAAILSITTVLQKKKYMFKNYLTNCF